ncbi:hypothetical protein HaLaN_31956 [Haematococcus lacustris]|uniref:Uncharacterized protein n=1 Tax=Haematococcus lacustris TaxID=44745 RepID=A0A6A0ALL1_HAELA|nr:hypothetical protein HaLaN_31956 [Haematococcus lacustris]
MGGKGRTLSRTTPTLTAMAAAVSATDIPVWATRGRSWTTSFSWAREAFAYGPSAYEAQRQPKVVQALRVEPADMHSAQGSNNLLRCTSETLRRSSPAISLREEGIRVYAQICTKDLKILTESLSYPRCGETQVCPYVRTWDLKPGRGG